MAVNDRIQLTLVNQVLGKGKKQIAVLDKSKGVAWRVFELDPLEKSPAFLYTPLEVNISDAYGNYTLIQPAQPGHRFQIVDSPSGIILDPLEEKGSGAEIQITNNLRRGTMNVHFFRNEILFAEQFGVAAAQVVGFEFEDRLSVAVTDGIVEGQMLEEKMLATINTEFSMADIKSAEIVVRGEGSSYEFALENVNH